MKFTQNKKNAQEIKIKKEKWN